MTSRAKAEARKAKAIAREAAKNPVAKAADFSTKLSPDELERFGAFCKAQGDIGPTELAKRIAALVLAGEVREYFKAEIPNQVLDEEERSKFEEIFGAELPVGATTHDLAGFGIDYPNVEEILEGMVEGDGVIDSERVHAWHKRKLDEFRDQCIKLDEQDIEMTALTNVINVVQAIRSGDYDVIVDGCVPDNSPDPRRDVIDDQYCLLASPAALTILPGPEEFHPVPPNMSADWKTATVTRNEDAPYHSRRGFAQLIADNTPLRVGVTGKFSAVTPVPAKECAA